MYLARRQNGSPQLPLNSRRSKVAALRTPLTCTCTPEEIAATGSGFSRTYHMGCWGYVVTRLRLHLSQFVPSCSCVATNIISSIDVSTAFLQADEYEPDAITRHVYYQPGPHMPSAKGYKGFPEYFSSNSSRVHYRVQP